MASAKTPPCRGTKDRRRPSLATASNAHCSSCHNEGEWYRKGRGLGGGRNDLQIVKAGYSFAGSSNRDGFRHHVDKMVIRSGAHHQRDVVADAAAGMKGRLQAKRCQGHLVNVLAPPTVVRSHLR